MSDPRFEAFFQGTALDFLVRAIDLALEEDGPDLTSMAVFTPQDRLNARIVAKQDTLVAGLPIARLVIDRLGETEHCRIKFLVDDGALVPDRTLVATMDGPAVTLLKAERVILNFLCHLSGIANRVRLAVTALAGGKTRLLDTRKTLPGLRYPEKYAVLVGGGVNHRKNLAEMLMLKDNHIDRAGGIPQAMAALRNTYHGSMHSMPPVEIECRTLAEVRQAVAENPARLMLDNMDLDTMRQALALVPPGIETEVSGGVSQETLAAIGALGPDFVSVGRITHSAESADFSMLLEEKTRSMNASPAEHITAIRRARGGDLAILAHHYQRDEVVRHADILGDSLELSRKVPNLSARDIVFCGVFFMAETAAMLAGPGQRIHIPATDAACVMSEMAPAGLVETVLTRIAAAGRDVLPLTYVNSSAAVKAACGRRGGTVCTSANASIMLGWALDQGRGVLFLPDKMLGQNTCRALGIPRERLHVLDIRGGGEHLDLEAIRRAEVLLWPGQCVIHSRFRPGDIEAVRRQTPEAKVVVHPECAPETVEAADAAGSTSFIIKYVAESPPGADIVIGTEIHLVSRLAIQYQGLKTIRPLRESGCSNMAKGTEANLLAALTALNTAMPVIVPDDVREPARTAVERMLDVTARAGR
jgi:quinolinate synthase